MEGENRVDSPEELQRKIKELEYRVEKNIRDIEEELLPIIEKINKEKAELLKHKLKLVKEKLPVYTKISIIEQMLRIAANALGEDFEALLPPEAKPPADLPED